MNLAHKIEVWGDNHHPKILDVIRIALGVFLLLKGIAFMENSNYLKDLIENQTIVNISPDLLMAIVYYVTFVHLVGGILISLGILTRLSCILQIPVVLAAVLLSNIFQDQINAMAWPSVTALALLCLFTIIGSGPLSLDKYLSGGEAESGES
jgi:putative oxidoreductase